MRKNEYLFLENDLMFKNTFGTEENKKLTIDMLEKLFNYEKGTLKDAKIDNSIVLDKETVKEKKFELDIVVETLEEKINIEMQRVLDKTSEIKNFMYVTRMFSGELKRGEKYRNMKKITQVEFSKERQIHKNNGIISEYCMCNKDNPEDRMLEREFRVIKIDLDAKSEEENGFELWRKFIGSTDERELEELAAREPILREAKEAMESFMEKEYVQDYTMEREYIEARIEEAKDRGHTEGIEASRKEIAKNLLKNTDNSIEVISSCTGLTLEEINKIKEEI